MTASSGSTISARNVLLDYLAQREHSLAELRTKALKRLGSGREVEIEEALETLVEEGLQSDARFAESLCRHRVLKGYGPVFLRQALREKGIDKDTQLLVFDALEVDWFDCAQSALRKKFSSPISSSLDRKERLKEMQRRMRFLSYRGFPADIVSAVVAADDDA